MSSLWLLNLNLHVFVHYFKLGFYFASRNNTKICLFKERWENVKDDQGHKDVLMVEKTFLKVHIQELFYHRRTLYVNLSKLKNFYLVIHSLRIFTRAKNV